MAQGDVRFRRHRGRRIAAWPAGDAFVAEPLELAETFSGSRLWQKRQSRRSIRG